MPSITVTINIFLKFRALDLNISEHTSLVARNPYILSQKLLPHARNAANIKILPN